jgi:hypothetical protein
MATWEQLQEMARACVTIGRRKGYDTWIQESRDQGYIVIYGNAPLCNQWGRYVPLTLYWSYAFLDPYLPDRIQYAAERAMASWPDCPRAASPGSGLPDVQRMWQYRGGRYVPRIPALAVSKALEKLI